MIRASFSTTRRRRWLTAVFLLVGLALIAVYGMRTFRSFSQMRYVQSQGLEDGTASLEAIRPWMTIGYIAVAYAVPEEYIYAQLDIPFEQRRQRDSIGELNRQLGLGQGADGHTLQIEAAIKAAIEAYRQNPVVVGLDDVRGWMTVRYISVSTGVPEATIFEAIGIPMVDNNEFKELRRLARDYRYDGGGRALETAVRRALDEATP